MSDFFFFSSSSVKWVSLELFCFICLLTWDLAGQHQFCHQTPDQVQAFDRPKLQHIFQNTQACVSFAIIPSERQQSLPPPISSPPLLFSWLRLSDSTVLTYLQLDFKKLEVLHATFGIFSSPHLWVWIGVLFFFFRKILNFVFFFFPLRYVEASDCRQRDRERWGYRCSKLSVYMWVKVCV